MGFTTTRSSSNSAGGNVPLGGYADVFTSGLAFKATGTLIQRSLYPEMSNAFPRKGSFSAVAATLPSATGYTGIAFGNGLFVAATGYTGSPGTAAATSTDGITWTPRAMPVPLEWRAMAFGAGLFVAIGTNNSNTANAVYATSTDGINWTARNMGVPAVWASITYSTALGLFIAIAGGYNSQSNIAATSPDGLVWTARVLPVTGYWQSVCPGPAMLVAANANGSSSGSLANSVDGANWTTRAAAAGTSSGVAYGAGLFVSVGMLGMNTSADGITWTPRSVPSTWNCTVVAYGNGCFVAAGAQGSNIAFTSPDGINWTPRNIVSANSLIGSLVYGAGTFVQLGGSNQTIANLLFVENLTDSDYMYIGGTAGKFVRVK
jgi:hypothetical protein